MAYIFYFLLIYLLSCWGKTGELGIFLKIWKSLAFKLFAVVSKSGFVQLKTIRRRDRANRMQRLDGTADSLLNVEQNRGAVNESRPSLE